MHAGRPLLIDVLEADEYGAERIAGALLFPLSTFGDAASPDDGVRRVVFHCGSGKRSLTAAERRLAVGGRKRRTWVAGSRHGSPRDFRWYADECLSACL